MSATPAPTGRQVRDEIGHPIIDGDGHLTELTPAAYPFLREHLSAAQFDRFVAEGTPTARGLAYRSADQQRRTLAPQSAWWGGPTHDARDKAAPMLPDLLAERLPELGIDFGIFYTSSAMGFLAVDDGELRRGLAAGWNDFLAELGRPHTERMTFAGLVPMHSPEEAIAELGHCARLGLKVAAFPEGVLRPIPEPEGPSASPFLWPGQTHWFDTYGLESAYDYDPVWEEARRLELVVTFHGGMGLRPGLWTFPNNYCANHIGVFAQNMFSLCKSLFLGGVTRRFPDVGFAFLECGVSWAAQLLVDLVGHFEKRRVSALGDLDPARLDVAQMARHLAQYGETVLHLMGDPDPLAVAEAMRALGARRPDRFDDFEYLEVGDDEDALVGLFADSFYFGCEADDRGVVTAFSPMTPGGRPLGAFFSSDIGHWDVPHLDAVVPESYELVADGLLSPEQYRAFVFDHVVRLCTTADPDFFSGTTVEAAVASYRSAAANH